MNLRHLHAFATIVDVGGLAKAATRLHLSQPALSRQIQTLESDLGVALFDRDRSARATDVARRRPAAAQPPTARRSRVARRAGARAQERRNRNSQGRRDTTGDRESARGFSDPYRRRHPGVEVHLVEDGGARLIGRLERGEVHLSITPAGMTRFEGRLLYPIHVVAALPSAHRLARRDSA